MGNYKGKEGSSFYKFKRHGTFGKVWKTKYKKDGKIYAIKEISKEKIILSKCEKEIIQEKEMLSSLHSKFIGNMFFSFQDKDNLYLVLDYIGGGDIRYHLHHIKHFNEEQTIACIIISLEYIHSNNIIHRDIKPDNIVLDNNGYAKLVDFGIAIKKENIGNQDEMKGTFGYIAPEIILLQQHQGFCIDYFSMGILIYKMLFGEIPFQGNNINQTKEMFVHKEITIKHNDINKVSKECLNFIIKLLKRKPKHRLGFTNGVQEFFKHKWFENFNWNDLKKGKMKAIFIPKEGDNYDHNIFKHKEIDILLQINTEELNNLKKLKFKSFTFIKCLNNKRDSQNDSEQKHVVDVGEMNFFRRRCIFHNNFVNAFPTFIDEEEIDDSNKKIIQPKIIRRIKINSKCNPESINKSQNSSKNISDCIKDTNNDFYLPKINVNNPANYSSDKIHCVINKRKLNILNDQNPNNNNNESNYYNYIPNYNVKQKNNSAISKRKFFQYDHRNISNMEDKFKEPQENSFFMYRKKIKYPSMANIYKKNSSNVIRNMKHISNVSISKDKSSTIKGYNEGYQRYRNLPSLEVGEDYYY